MNLYFANLTVPANGVFIEYIDLSQCASIVNRRFYRQGLNWAVAGFKITTSADARASFSVFKLQNTWVTGGSWEKTMRHWKEQQDSAVDESGVQSAVARFRDYKIMMDDDHVAAWVAAGLDLNVSNILPHQYVPGEWDTSRIVIPNDGAPGISTEYALKMYGNSDANAKGIVEGYARSRSVPQSPNPTTANSVSISWLSKMTDVGDENPEILGNAQFENNDLPYDQDAYPGGAGNAQRAELHDQIRVSGTTIGGVSTLRGGNFPCGLIRIEGSDLSGTPEGQEVEFDLQVILVPGNHRGYLAEGMVDF